MSNILLSELKNTEPSGLRDSEASSMGLFYIFVLWGKVMLCAPLLALVFLGTITVRVDQSCAMYVKLLLFTAGVQA